MDKNDTPTTFDAKAASLSLAQDQTDRTKQEEQRERERTRTRNRLRDQINNRTSTLRALLDYLIRPTLTPEQRAIVADMIAAEYTATLDLIPDYIDVGGERYSLSRTLFDHYFGD